MNHRVGLATSAPTLDHHKGHHFRISISAPLSRISKHHRLPVLVSQCSTPTSRRTARTLLPTPLQGTTPPHPLEAMSASSVVSLGTMPMLVPRGMPRVLQASLITVDRGRLHSSSSSNNPETTRLPRATELHPWEGEPCSCRDCLGGPECGDW